jgi:hypothetical protein
MAAIVTGILGVSYIAGLTVYEVSTFLQAGRVLDSILASEGMISESYLVFGRRYQGEVEGRDVEVNFLPSQGIRPAQLNVYVETDIGTRMAIGRQRPLLDCRDCVRWEVAESRLGELQVYAEEEERVDYLLKEAVSREAVVRLLEDPKEYGFREIYLQPGRVWLHAHPQGMRGKLFRQWLEDVLVLAETGELEPPE